MTELLEHRAYQWASVALFALLLGAPLAGRLLGIGDDIAEIELRLPMPLPERVTSLEDLANFPAAMEAHLDDSFGFRSQLVTAHNLLHLALGVSGSPRYLVGKDGWFFHRTVDDVLAQARGVNRFGARELERWIHQMETRQRWLETRGIHFLIAIAPSKHSIYPEYLPDWARNVGPTRYEQLAARAKHSSLRLVDLHEPLRRAKSSGQVYYKTDGHWNDRGAFVVYEALGRELERLYPGLPLLGAEDFELRWETGPYGTITRGLNLLDYVHETAPSLELRGPSRVTERRLGRGPDFGWDQIVVAETELRDRPSVMFIRDSFATHPGRFLQESLHRTIFVHHRSGKFLRHQVERFAPDVVIYMMIERGLIWELVSG